MNTQRLRHVLNQVPHHVISREMRLLPSVTGCACRMN